MMTERRSVTSSGRMQCVTSSAANPLQKNRELFDKYPAVVAEWWVVGTCSSGYGLQEGVTVILFPTKEGAIFICFNNTMVKSLRLSVRFLWDKISQSTLGWL